MQENGKNYERWSLWTIWHQWKSIKNRLLCLSELGQKLECFVHVNIVVVFLHPPSSLHRCQIALKPLGPSVVQYFRTNCQSLLFYDFGWSQSRMKTLMSLRLFCCLTFHRLSLEGSISEAGVSNIQPVGPKPASQRVHSGPWVITVKGVNHCCSVTTYRSIQSQMSQTSTIHHNIQHAPLV